MSAALSVRNRQRARAVHVPLLRRLARWLLIDKLGRNNFDLSIQLVAAPAMAQLNEQFLQHSGSTDVITFDYTETGSAVLHGEIVICLADAAAQAREFRVTWQSELARYLIHGLLHLIDYDDTTPAARTKMKRVENRLLRETAERFDLAALGKLVSSRSAPARNEPSQSGRNAAPPHRRRSAMMIHKANTRQPQRKTKR